MEGWTRGVSSRGNENSAGLSLNSILRDGEIGSGSAVEGGLRLGDQLALQAALTMPEGLASFLSPAPVIVKQAQIFPEWP